MMVTHHCSRHVDGVVAPYRSRGRPAERAGGGTPSARNDFGHGICHVLVPLHGSPAEQVLSYVVAVKPSAGGVTLVQPTGLAAGARLPGAVTASRGSGVPAALPMGERRHSTAGGIARCCDPPAGARERGRLDRAAGAAAPRRHGGTLGRRSRGRGAGRAVPGAPRFVSGAGMTRMGTFGAAGERRDSAAANSRARGSRPSAGRCATTRRARCAVTALGLAPGHPPTLRGAVQLSAVSRTWATHWYSQPATMGCP